MTVALGVGVSVGLTTGAALKSGGRMSSAPRSTMRITIIAKIAPVIPMRGMRLRFAILGMEAAESWELFRLRARTGFCGLTAWLSQSVLSRVQLATSLLALWLAGSVLHPSSRDMNRHAP